jgi:hypothetical protein
MDMTRRSLARPALPLFLALALVLALAWSPALAQKGGPSLNVNKRSYSPGEQIVVQFTADPSWAANAWIGIIPAAVPHGSEAVNDRYDVAYQYIRKRPSGTMVFKAPLKPGAWTIRMHDTDNNGREVASVSFMVQGAAVSPLSLNKTSFQPGEQIVVKFQANPAWAANAWIGIIPAAVPHGSEAVNDRFDVAYQYIRKRASGTMVFKAPLKPGAWTIRMHDTDNNGREVASVSFMVVQ